MTGLPMNASAEPRGANKRGTATHRIDAGRPSAHVAAEAGIPRRCLAKRYARWRAHGEELHRADTGPGPPRTPDLAFTTPPETPETPGVLGDDD
ncbi:hypothetical protein [Streptomyces sp. NPDC005498]|uniref:hypothetical protein n=1 Tax=Streptomyces sp. NPDC005498 TaxID=3364717 RepID=UPI00368C35B1